MMKILKKIDVTLAILIGLLLIAVVIALLKGGTQLTWQGIVQTGRLLETVWLRLPLGFALGGLIQVLVPRGVIARWLGPASGIKGILIGSYTGSIFSGAPYVMLPVVASLYLAGAGAGPIIALLTGTGSARHTKSDCLANPIFGCRITPVKIYCLLIHHSAGRFRRVDGL